MSEVFISEAIRYDNLEWVQSASGACYAPTAMKRRSAMILMGRCKQSGPESRAKSARSVDWNLN
ncbi:MAG: hypothetical protein V8S27_09875 [Lachnospiraceae bacterium]